MINRFYRERRSLPPPHPLWMNALRDHPIEKLVCAVAAAGMWVLVG